MSLSAHGERRGQMQGAGNQLNRAGRMLFVLVNETRQVCRVKQRSEEAANPS